jgi:hypothetical protein
MFLLADVKAGKKLIEVYRNKKPLTILANGCYASLNVLQTFIWSDTGLNVDKM